MQPSPVPNPPARPPRTWVQRLFGRWWRRQSPARQDRFATLGPLVSVLLFLAAIISTFWYLRNEEFEREQASVKRDTEVAQQQIRLRLIENQEQLVRIAREIVTRTIDQEEFLSQASSFTRERPEITSLVWVDAQRARRASYSATTFQAELGAAPETPGAARPPEPDAAFDTARELRQPVYSRPFNDRFGNAVFQIHVPLLDRSNFAGALVAEYSAEGLVRYFVPAEVSNRHAITLLDASDRTLASTVASTPSASARRPQIVHDVPVAPAGNGLVLRGYGYRTSIGLISNALFWMVAALSVLTVWMLLGTWRHMRRRVQMQSALVSETNFRRAMENSMLTGMRAMDLEGRITYVNPAFCAMTGFLESDLIGRRPPFPYWPPDRFEENSRLLQQELQGRSPAGGIEVRVMRKDGSVFDARMYVSPLIDPKGQQTGWMTSMTNITEAKRIRDQLSASHERFTTVLEGLDAAVSVLSVQQAELLFANRSYRLWFGADAQGHALLAGAEPENPFRNSEFGDTIESLGGVPTTELTEAGSDSREVFIELLRKWFDVRARYLQWTDGRLAQMLIATDITARRNAETLAAAQAEKAQVTSRLVTMGEMASSVAHELNQPLTAITNYCNGMVSRVRNDAIAKDDLIAALEKTSRQAQRAGQIIHRIRAFVKRSEPVRQPAQARQIVEDAVELAGIELRRRNVAIQVYVAQRLPMLMVDPILIEQVVLNLVKNAAEAIDNAQLPPARRNIELRVVPRHTPEEGGVIEFTVTDMGPGLKEEVIARMYEAFFSTKTDGLGIGLSLCRSIIESHRGRIRAQNLYNGSSVSGCRFSFTLPVDTARSEVPPTPHSTVVS
ncbi:MAG: PAS domain S-box protein [Piscinibacter sp.]|nr:PAS domain S-box protein [Piscinibacter sp.]